MVRQMTMRRPLIAITGSAGKTTTKEMLAAILQTRWRILKSVQNMNFVNHTMAYKRKIAPYHQAIVLEYGLSGPGHIRRHCQVLKPNMGIITNIGTAHIGSFGGDVRKLAAAKSELIQNMDQTGTLVLNRDDENSKWLLTGGFRGKIIYVGINKAADYQASGIQYALHGMRFKVKLNGQIHDFYIPTYGVHHVYNALSAIAVAHRLGFTPSEIRLGLRNYVRLIRRLQIHRIGQGIRIVDDSYSANPQAVKAALDVLSHIGNGTNIAVLGSMLGMGVYSTKAHRTVGRYVAGKKVHQLYTFGEPAQQIGVAARGAGFPAQNVFHFVNRDALNRQLKRNLKPGTTVLIKGSHAMKMKETVDYLLRHGKSRNI